MRPILKITILALICLLAFLVRIFSVIRFESIIHEFDPWFNFRTTKFLEEKGWYEFWNWFDSESWYPLGRVIGGTIYPGIMGTATGIKWSLDALSLPMDIRNVCVFLAPVFSGMTSISTYFLTKEATNKPLAGLFSALFISIIPSYISRSVAGSYDNEGVAIFALVNTFFLWLKACNTGSILWAVACTLQYFYMVAAWGGYAFIINIIPIFVICIIFVNKFNMKIYIAYTVFYILGTILAMTIPFVTFQAIKSSEHLLSHCVFFLMNAFVFVEFIKANLPEKQFAGLLRVALSFAIILFVFVFVYLTISGNTKWSGRSMSLLDPTYAKKYIPIVASVSEHQPTAWANYFFDLGYVVFFMPAGYWFCLKDDVTHGKIFLALFGVLSTYFSCVMIRLMLTLAPVACIIAGIAVSEIFTKIGESTRQHLKEYFEEDTKKEEEKEEEEP
jgi:dolichyl-diphosphooligosaccharide---protein glycosyltransferase